MKTGFLRALWGSCCGTEIFRSLRQQSFGRASWHLLLMTVLVSLIAGYGIYCSVHPAVKRAAVIVCQEFGGLRMDQNGLWPERKPDEARNVLLPGAIAVTYIPGQIAESSEAVPEIFKTGLQDDTRWGVVWTPKHLGAWRREGNAFVWSALGGTLQNGVSSVSIGSAEALWKQVKTEAPLNWLDDDGPMNLSAESIMLLTDYGLAVGLAFTILMQNYLQVVLYIFMFAVVFLLMNWSRWHRYGWKELAVLEIYAGFPAMLTGAVADALQLPVLNFGMVYALGMTFYLTVILNRLERDREREGAVSAWEDNQKAERKDEENDRKE